MTIIALLMAIVGVVISIVALYFTQLQAPKLKSLSGPFIKIYYADYEIGSSFGLYIPVTFINTSTTTGTISNAAIRLYREELPDQSYFMQWREFSKLHVEKAKWGFEEIAHAIAMPGKSTITKVIWFFWGPTSQPKLVIQKGSYKIDIYFWENPDQPPHQETHAFVISDSLYNTLETFRTEQKMTTVDIRLDQQIEENRFMTKHEVKRLL